MKKSGYRIDNDVLSIHTACGVYKFRIDNDTGPTDAQTIAELMVSEMENVDTKFQSKKEASSPYARLLLATLNIAGNYVRLASRYNQLLGEQDQRKTAARDTAVKTTAKAAPPEDIPQPTNEDSAQPTAATQSVQVAEPPPAPEPPASPIEPVTVQASPPTVLDHPIVVHGSEKPQPDEPDPLPVSQGVDTKTESMLLPMLVPKAEPESKPSPAVTAGSPTQVRIDAQPVPITPAMEAAAGSEPEYKLPPLNFLKRADQAVAVDHEAIRRDAELLERKLGYFGIKGEVMEVSPGPVITTFEYKPAPGIKISKIVNLADDLALALSAVSIRLVAPIPGKDVIGIEIPNPQMSIVPFIDVVNSEAFATIDSPTPICLGKDIIGKPVVVGLERMPHLLIAGATGTGKSVALNAMITSILYKSRPDQVKFIMIDPKRIELSLFNDIPHLLTPVITDMRRANIALQWVVREMERRYEKLAAYQVRNIEQYNEKIGMTDPSLSDDGDTDEAFPYIVVIIDELADLMMTASKDIEFSLTRIAQMARAAGIHLILATQRPSVDVLTGIIKANFPTRISFQVSSKTDSRTIIDANGAETLLGRGDMLFVPPGTARLTRVHGTYLSEAELIAVTDFVKSQGKPEYVMDVITEKEEEEAAPLDISDDDYDEKYEDALEFVLSTRQATISSVQRALRVGYNRAARIIDMMEKRGIISASDGIKPRQVLVDRSEWMPY
ncbi:FtsK2 [Desulfosarcina cetonica]|uniref:DNA translocase FtsK n=1 Tax=Desulfosarcina cetonica TaxID=90730 RepID=UPI0006D091B0|nr:DNA translocase FtsK [Desulfosarcina cetonica]VTR68188.1 FtsK2 [Desulfosarcina cetonica]